MKLATFRISGRISWGIVEGNEVIDVGAVLRDKLPDLKAATADDSLSGLGAQTPDALRHSLTAIEWLPVNPVPDNILCIGLNYETHRKETRRAKVENPTVFARYANGQIGRAAPINDLACRTVSILRESWP